MADSASRLHPDLPDAQTPGSQFHDSAAPGSSKQATIASLFLWLADAGPPCLGPRVLHKASLSLLVATRARGSSLARPAWLPRLHLLLPSASCSLASVPAQ